jgi:hypothetical protein
MVESKTPATMLAKLETSIRVKVSKPQLTAKLADVMGSAALMVSTKAAELPLNPILVAQKPSVKQSPAKINWRVLVVCNSVVAV